MEKPIDVLQYILCKILEICCLMILKEIAIEHELNLTYEMSPIYK